MFKKIVYSFMAMSLTLMPASEVMAATEIDSVTMPLTSGDYSVDGTNYQWENTATTVQNGNTAGTSGANVIIQGYTPTVPETVTVPNYTQTAGTLQIINKQSGTHNPSKFTMIGVSTAVPLVIAPAYISGGSVQVGEDSTTLVGNSLTLAKGSRIDSTAQVNLFNGNSIKLSGNIDQSTPTLVMSNFSSDSDSPYNDRWEGTIVTSGDGILSVQGFNSLDEDGNPATDAIYQQTGGSLWVQTATVSGTDYNSELWLNNQSSFIDAGNVIIDNNNTLVINTKTNATYESDGTTYTPTATLGQGAIVNINNGGTLKVLGEGTAILNDVNVGDDDSEDTWSGHVQLGDGTDGETPVLTLYNVHKDFTSGTETATFIQDGGTLNIYSNDNGGSDITTRNYYTEGTKSYGNLDGTVNIKGDTTVEVSAADVAGGAYYNTVTRDDDGNITGYYNDRSSTLNIIYGTNDTRTMDINLQGHANLSLQTQQIGTDEDDNPIYSDIVTNVAPTGKGDANNVEKTGLGTYYVGDYDDTTGTVNPIDNDVNMGYNMQVAQGNMLVLTNGKLKVGLTTADSTPEHPVTANYGDLIIGDENNTTTTNFFTTASSNQIVGSLMLYDGTYNQITPTTSTVGGDFYVIGNSGVDMLNGTIDKINIAGNTVMEDDSTLNLKIDVDPRTYSSDSINASSVTANSTTTLNLTDYNLLSMPRRNRYTFKVLTGTTFPTDANKVVATTSDEPETNASRIIATSIGDYKMFPSAVKGAFDLALFRYNPQVFRGPIAENIIYANQTLINNQLFDRMFYSNLPYFNGRCTNKTAAADTLYSPYQYTTEDTGLWFKPYANFETISMNRGLKNVRNNAYGAMIGVDFGRKDFGSWSFIPTVFIGYNGGRITYNGVGMWQNGGQAGFMGTLTHRDFVTSFAVYGGGYHNSMDVLRKHDHNALWNAGIASKTAYNIHLPWDFILQPNLYLAYNYVGESKFTSSVDGFTYKTKPLNAFSIAPGVNLIWQKETFSIYALFQAMFNINSLAGAKVADIDLPRVGITDPYFEYGVGATKYFKNRFSGYGQVVGHSGARKGIGFQLGLNLKI